MQVGQNNTVMQGASHAFAACDAVFSVSELREMILLGLPIHDLLRCRQVCKEWESTWKGTKIQQALFLRGFGGKTVSLTNAGTWNVKSANGIVSTMHPVLNPFLHRFLRRVAEAGYVMEDDCDDPYTSDFDILTDVFIYGTNTKNRGERPEADVLAFHHPDASWRGMLFTQPPLRLFEAFCYNHRHFYGINNPKGVTVDQVHELIYNHCRTCVDCPVWAEQINRIAWRGSEEVVKISKDVKGRRDQMLSGIRSAALLSRRGMQLEEGRMVELTGQNVHDKLSQRVPS